jgi:hypothetical protein
VVKSLLACATLALGSFALAAFPAAQAAQGPVPLPPIAPTLKGAQPQEVDVALVLAVDVSGSIDYEEAELQRKGIIDAVMSKEVIQAIQSGSLGRIGISVVYFSSADYGVMSVPVNWMILQDQASAINFSKALVAARRPSARGTSISDALELSLRMLETGPYHSVKQVIDVSGDGVAVAEVRTVRALREFIPFGREDAAPADGLEAETQPADSGKEVHERERIPSTSGRPPARCQSPKQLEDGQSRLALSGFPPGNRLNVVADLGRQFCLREARLLTEETESCRVDSRRERALGHL